MLSRHILLGVFGLSFGLAASAGTFAFLMVLGVVPRLVGKSHSASAVLWYEEAIILGGIFGNLISVFLGIPLRFGHAFLYIYGLSTGIFVGCMAMALAEILNTFPIMFRRFRLKTGLIPVVTAMALGKMSGALYYFLFIRG